MNLPHQRQPAAALSLPVRLARSFLLSLAFLAAPASAVDLLVSNFTDTPDPATRGGKIAYSATITNNESDTASDVKLTFTLDAETSFDSVSDAVRCSYLPAGHKVECAYPSVRGDLSGPGSADEFTATVTVTSKASAGATVTASAAVAGAGVDTNPGNNSLNQISTIDNGADLALALSGSPNPVIGGGTLTYTASATNQGPNPAGATTVALTLSPNLSYTSASGSGWTCGAAGQVVTCTRATAAVGALPNISVVTKVTGAQAGTLTSSGTVSISGSATDYDHSNDTTTADVTVNPGADLAITKVASSAKPESGGPVVFTLRPRNLGPFSASSVVVTDTLPAGFSGIAASGSGWSCGVAGQTVTCSRATYAVGAVDDISVSATSPSVASATPYTNTAGIDSATPDPVTSNDSGSVSVNVMPPGVDLSITKSKTPDPVAQGSPVSSTIRVTNNGPQSARANEITVVETLQAGETFGGVYSGANWTCGAQIGQTVTCTYGAALALNASTSNLVLTTTAAGTGVLTNQACAAYADSVASMVDGNTVNNCASASVTSTPTPDAIDLRIAKTVDVDPLAWNANTLTYTITVTNVADADATGVVMTDAIPGHMTGTGVSATHSGGTAAATFSCSSGATVTCTQTGGTIAKNQTAVFQIAVTRPMVDSGAGKHTNTARVTSTAQGDLNPADNQASVDVKVEAVADIRVTSSATPTSTEAGTNVTYVLTVDNLGPSTASGITLRQVFGISAGTLTYLSYSSGASCTWDAGASALDCTLGSLARNATTTVTVVVRPDYMSGPPPVRTLTGTATVATTTNESVMGNNTAVATVSVTQAALDLLVNNSDSPDPLGFVPAGAGPVYPDNVVTYRNTITNRGPSVASNLVLTYTMTPPAGKAMTFLGDKLTASGQAYSNYCNNQNAQATSATPLTLTCTFPANMILLANNATTDLYLDFRVDTAPTGTGDTFQSVAAITSNEPDTVASNNSIGQTTTVKMRSDLQLSKSARAFDGGADTAVAAVQLRQPFYWVLTLTNAGPGNSQTTSISDTLPAGLSLYTPGAGAPAPYNAAPYNGGVRWSTNNAVPTSGTCSGTGALSCAIGLLESGKTATVLVPVIATSTGNRNNCASATTSEVDPNLANNTNACASVTVQASSLAGAVYADQNANGARGAGEPGIASVALLLSGTDAYGNAVSRNATSAADGSFSFASLSPGSYTLTETQPAPWVDGVDLAGSAGGTPGAIGTDAIAAIALPGNTAATGYLFGEVGTASLSGYVFVDSNTNALRDGGEAAGIAGVTMTLTGTDDTGAVNKTATTGAGGLYTFSDLRPGTYQVQQAVIPGLTHTGMSAGSKGGKDGAAVLAPNAAVPGADKRSISEIVLVGGDAATGYNFGESGQGLSGFVYVDRNGNGVKDADEVGIAGVSLTLSGTTAGGASICAAISPNPCTVQTGSNGAYAFSGLPASDASGYTITEQSQASAPLASYADGSERAGSLGGNASANDLISGIVLALGQFGTNYDFGERASAIAGRVYLDANDNGALDATENGIEGVNVVLSGRTASGADVCTVLASCTVVSAADGSFEFGNLPAADNDGYTLTETQPLDYAERSNAAGSAGGTVGASAGNSTVSGIKPAAGTAASGYLFGEKAGALGGHAYLDANNNGVRDAGETGIAGVSFTLSGSTASSVDVCTRVTCTVQSGADGSYRFAGLPNAGAGGYTITQQSQSAEPLASLLDGKVSAGSNCGSCSVGAGVPNAISAVRVVAGTAFDNYDFGELQPASLAGSVYVDTNLNGVQDAGEALAGVTLTLGGNDDLGNAVSRTATSGADGSYSFGNLRPSAVTGYTVTESQPAGYGDFAGASGTKAGSAGGSAAPNAVATVVLASGVAATGYDFRETGSSLSGRVYLDMDDNGLYEASETPLAGVTLTLTGVDARGVAVHQVVQSANDGSYRFGGLGGGTYTITETHPSGVLDGRERAGSSGGAVDNGSFDDKPARNTIAAIALAAGLDATGYDFGERPLPAPAQGSLAGRVYIDLNGNGAADAEEPGIAGVALTLSGVDATGAKLERQASTGADGRYAFTGLPASSTAGYQLAEIQPAGYRDGQNTIAAGNPGSAASAKPVAAGAPDRVDAIVVAAGAILGGYDFGERSSSGSLSGVVYLDRDDDGEQDGDEPGIAGAALVLSGTDADGKEVRRETTSGADGGFRFADLAPSGKDGYLLTEIQPAGYADGKTTLAAGTPGTPGAKPLGAEGRDTVGAIALAAGQDLAGYRFGELSAARIGGSVFVDRNGNGQRDEGETGIPGVTVQLSGRQSDGTPVERSTVTAADGGFRFEGLAPSDSTGYRLVEVQPAAVNDGRTTVPSGLPGTAAGSKPVGVGDQDLIQAIQIGVGTVADGYLFGETAIPSLKPPIVNGYVWLDRGHNRVRPVDGSMQGLAGWTVELRQQEKTICRVSTDAEGFYQFDNLRCAGYEVDGLPTGGGFSIAFSREGSTLPAVAQSGGNKGKVVASGGMITDISLSAGEQVMEQNLPLDPAGVVYDLRTRKPVAGATVSIDGPPGFVPARHLVGAEAAKTQVVGDDGMYQFLLQNDFPSGVYTLSVVSPAGYLPGPSTELKACPGAPVVTLVPTPALVQRSEGAPAASVPLHRPDSCAGIVAGGADSTQYYLGFHITNGGSAPILNNHIPLDPVASGGVVVTKTTPMVNVARGELVPYTITAVNGTDAALGGVVLRDRMPPGFKYRPGSARIKGVPTEPKVNGRELSWAARNLAPREQVSITLVLAVGAGVGEGEYVNHADAVNMAGSPVSNLATAAVRIVPDATFDCPDVIGKVFDDANANGYQDEGEAGLPSVRLATPRGLLVTTDAQGRFHVPCADLPNQDRGANFVMKLDDRTLPSGYRVTTDNPGDVRVTRGKVAKLNFGATIHRVVRLELSDAAFEDGGDQLAAPWKQQIDIMMEQLKKKPSVLRIAYQRGAADEEAVRRRVAQLRQQVRERWKAQGDIYPLAIEVEDVR